MEVTLDHVDTGLRLIQVAVILVGGWLGYRFKALEKQQAESVKALKEKYRVAKDKADENEKSLLRLRAELPLDYVRREDWIRNQTVIEAKLDALAMKLDNQGGTNGR